MFEIGIQLRKERGPDNVFDFSIGNPDVEPPAAVIAALRRVVAEDRPRSHGYMPNAGFPEVRAAVAGSLAARTGIAFTADDVLMTSGAAGAINIVLKSILDPGDMRSSSLTRAFPNTASTSKTMRALSSRSKPTSAFCPMFGEFPRRSRRALRPSL